MALQFVFHLRLVPLLCGAPVASQSKGRSMPQESGQRQPPSSHLIRIDQTPMVACVAVLQASPFLLRVTSRLRNGYGFHHPAPFSIHPLRTELPPTSNANCGSFLPVRLTRFQTSRAVSQVFSLEERLVSSLAWCRFGAPPSPFRSLLGLVSLASL